MSLSKILKQIEINRPNAEMDVSLGSPNTYGGRVGLKRAATEAMKYLKMDYRNELLSSTVFIVVVGSARDSFTATSSSEEFGCFSADPDEFYKNLVSRISPTLFGREGVRQLFNIAGNILEDKATELGLNSYFGLEYSEKYNSTVTKAEDFVPIIRTAINDRMGAEIVGINSVALILDSAINKNHSAPVTPLILNTSDEKFALELYKNLPNTVPQGTFTDAQHAAKKKVKSFLVIAGKASKTLSSTPGAILVKTVSQETVGEALSSIRSKVL